jgi:TctA family transporter
MTPRKPLVPPIHAPIRTHPISAGILLVAVTLLLIPVLPQIRNKREEVFSEAE